MTKFSECGKVSKFIISAAGLVAAVGILAGAAAWAGDTVFWSHEEQSQYTEELAANELQRDISKLKREIFKLQLEVDAGKASPEDKAYLQFLKQDLEELTQ